MMVQILVRNLEPEVVARLKEQAERNGRSLRAEVAQILRAESRRKTVPEA